MPTYNFQYRHGQSAPHKVLEAEDDADFYTQLAAFERESGFKHIPDSIICTVSTKRRVPEPPARIAA